MKKLLLVLVAAAALTACTKEYNSYTEMNRIIIDCKAYANDWIAGPDKNSYPEFYYCDFQIPEIDNFLYNNGTVVAYYEYTDADRQVQKALPCVIPKWDKNDPSITWTEVIDFEYERGWIRFKVTNDDFNYGEPPINPGNKLFRVVIIW